MRKHDREPDRSSSRKSGRLWLLGILLFAAATRLLYLYFYRADDPLYSQLFPDARNYHEWAAAIARGIGWEQGPFYQAPLYPYALALFYLLFGASPVVAYLFQLLSGIFLILAIYRVGSRAYETRSGLIAAALASLYGVFLFHETKILPGAVSALLAVLTIERMQAADASPRGRSWIVAGIVTGLLIVASAGIILLVPLSAGWILFDSRRSWSERSRRLLFLLLGVIIVITPVTLRNKWIGGDTVLISSNGGIVFYVGNNPTSIGLYAAPESFSHSIFEQRRRCRELAEQETKRPMRDSEVSRFWFRKGTDFIKKEPARFLRLLSSKAGLALDNYEHALEYDAHLDANPVRHIVPLPFALILGLGVARFFMGPKWKRAESPLLFLLAAQFFMFLMFYVSGRYRLIIMPSLIILAGCGVASLKEDIRFDRRRSVSGILAAIIVILFSFFYIPVRYPHLHTREEAMALCDTAGAYLISGQTDRAVELYREAARLYPEYPYAHLLLARALKTKGDLSSAEQEFSLALTYAPELSEAYFDLGVLLYETERPDQAAEKFAEAFRLDPSNSNAGNNLIGTCLKIGRYEQAIQAWKEMKERDLPVDPPLESWMTRNVSSFKNP